MFDTERGSAVSVINHRGKNCLLFATFLLWFMLSFRYADCTDQSHASQAVGEKHIDLCRGGLRPQDW